MARAWAAITLAVVAAMVAGFLWLKPFDALTASVPATEDVAFERVTTHATGFRAVIRADGSEPVAIAQVLVDGAYRTFTQEPPGPVERLGRATLEIPYPWTEGEPHTLAVVTSTGLTFDHVVEVALDSAGLGGAGILHLIGIGLFVGFVPIAVGYGFLPILRRQGAAGRDFALGLTFGLLVFLLIDTTGEGLELAGEASGGLHAEMAFWTVSLLTAAALLLVARRGGAAPEGGRLAFFIALGIGLDRKSVV